MAEQGPCGFILDIAALFPWGQARQSARRGCFIASAGWRCRRTRRQPSRQSADPREVSRAEC